MKRVKMSHLKWLSRICIGLFFLIVSMETIYAKSVDVIDNVNQSGITITGVVVDKKTKESLPGVSIVIRGVSQGVITDIDGNYSVKVPYAEATLIFSYVGYQPQTIKLDGQTKLNVELVEDVQALEEVVVVGYATQKRENITGAVATITTKDLVQSPTANIGISSSIYFRVFSLSSISCFLAKVSKSE